MMNAEENATCISAATVVLLGGFARQLYLDPKDGNSTWSLYYTLQFYLDPTRQRLGREGCECRITIACWIGGRAPDFDVPASDCDVGVFRFRRSSFLTSMLLFSDFDVRLF